MLHLHVYMIEVQLTLKMGLIMNIQIAGSYFPLFEVGKIIMHSLPIPRLPARVPTYC
jgi:hypothetical protein